jgi:hypothetical protein
MARSAPAGNQPPAGNQTPIDSFLRPESMVTPGALGALTMLITNALANNFLWMGHAITALVLSFIFGITAMVKATEIWQKAVFYVINSLIIFSVATGSNQIGGSVTSGGNASRTQGTSLFVPSAYALTAGKLPNYHQTGDISPVGGFFQQWLPVTKVAPSNPIPPTTINPLEAKNGWSVVVGSFENKEDADKARNAINNALADHSAEVSTNSANGWVVTVGGKNLSLAGAAAIQQKAVSDGVAKEATLMRSDQLSPE